MRVWLLTPILGLSLFAALALSQQTIFPRGPQQAAATGSIEGVVVRADTGEPIAGAQVSLPGGIGPAPNAAVLSVAVSPVDGAARGAVAASSVQPPAGTSVLSLLGNNTPSTVTGPDGRFSFTGLYGGSYRLMVTANGFAHQEYGQVGVRGQGRALIVNAGQPLRDMVIRLAANGSVGGRIVDENGKPATSASIFILQLSYSAQGSALQPVGEGSVDDRGDFRIFDVPPGRYYLLAGSPPRSLAPILSGGVRLPAPRFGLLYYPNAADLSQASTVEVRSSAEALIDMRLTRQDQSYHVRGRVTSATGALPANVSVTMAYRFLSGGGSFANNPKFDPTTGAFDLQSVPPGDYAVQAQVPLQLASPAGPQDAAVAAARQAEMASRSYGQVPIRVVNADVDGVVITMSNGVSTTGRIVLEGQTATIPNVERMRLTFSPSTSMNAIVNVGPPIALPPAANGTFQVVGLRDGEYRVQFSAAGLYVKSILFGGMDIASAPFRFNGTDSGSFEIRLSSSSARITGTVVDIQSRPVTGIQVVAVPAQRGRTDLYRIGTTDATGRFTFAAMPPGDYRLFSWESLPSGAYYDPAFLRQYDAAGAAIHVEESSTHDVSVRLIPSP